MAAVAASLMALGPAVAQFEGDGVAGASGGGAAPPTWPVPIAQALARTGLPPQALAAVVLPLGSSGEALPPRLALQARQARPAASLMKLFTTLAALEQLGPAWTWRTPVFLDGPVRKGVLDGSVYIQGQGDPTLVPERLWLLLRELQARGVQDIRGDIVIDEQAFEASPAAPGDFDGEPLRPYNALPRAFSINGQAVSLRLRPDIGQDVAWVSVEPSLAGVRWPASVPLTDGDCGDWRGALRLDLEEPARPRLRGRFPVACGERNWELAWPQPGHHGPAAVEALWAELGGRLRGTVRPGSVPAGQEPAFLFASPPLAEVIRPINKFSNNPMARQLFLTLGLQAGEGSLARAREVVAAHARERAGCGPDELVLDNGSGLSREERASAGCLARLLQAAWGGPLMPEFLASLPIVGVDGTARRGEGAAGAAHVKTGSLRDVAGVAGVVLGQSGRRYAVVGILVHPQAQAGRPVLDELLRWAREDPVIPSSGRPG